MTLFTPAYEPKEYKSFLESEGRSAPIKHSTITLARQRSLIVDLEEPLFKWADLTRSSDELYNLMAPSKISFESYQKYLTVFEEYRSSHRDLHNSSQDVIIGKDGEYIVGGELVVYKGCFPTQLYMKYLKLNKGQQEAIQSVLAAQDYSLLQGLPGTGKSSTIALAIRILIARGQSVLLTSYTHSAVDNLLFKLIEEGMFKRQIIRLGSHYIDHALKDFTLCSSDESNLESDSNISVIARRCEAARLIVCTVLTASRSPLMNKVRTDYCIVDEAGQITQPAVIGAIVQAKVFVLIGDDRQLPPLVISKEAEQKGMGISLLARLVIAHPSVVKYLTAQYRMNSDIMLVSNSIFYSDAMSCANDRVAHAKLQIPRFPEFIVTKQLAINSWLYKTLDPNNSVVYLDMDSINQRTVNKNVTTSENSSSSVTNSAEAQLVKLIVDSLVNCGLPISNIAVISPFRAQVRAITEELHQNCDSLGGTNSHAVNCEVSTIDRFQGKDKDVMIVSTVRSVIGSTIDAGNLLKDSKRINVAVTRYDIQVKIVISECLDLILHLL